MGPRPCAINQRRGVSGCLPPDLPQRREHRHPNQPPKPAAISPAAKSAAHRRTPKLPQSSPACDIRASTATSHKEGASGLCLSDNGFATKTYRSTEEVPDADTV